MKRLGFRYKVQYCTFVKAKKMVYRKKILLALTEAFGGNIPATDFQKLLFLYTEGQDNRSFDFLPYKFGCFSFQAMAEKNKLVQEGYLENSKNWKLKISNGNFSDTLTSTDKRNLTKLKMKFDNTSTRDLIRYVYLNYPYFAINSEIAQNYLSEKELEVIERFKSVDEHTIICTIGYEGRSLESYINVLIQNNIKILIDVRKNPLSRKYGFSKKTLQTACDTVKIKYLHLPELGIESDKRKHLNTQSDYDKLFVDYENSILSGQIQALNLIVDIMKNYKRIALTCYEASPQQCHRTRVANKIHAMQNEFPVKHL